MDANERLHLEWLGMAQPEGLTVTLAALKDAEANITWPIVERQRALRDLTYRQDVVHTPKRIADLSVLFREILDWSDEFLSAGAAVPASFQILLDGGEILSPSLALRSAEAPDTFVLLVRETQSPNLDVDSGKGRSSATPHQRFERLLRETGVDAGLLTNGSDFRLVYAPRGESAGWITFRLADMQTVEGRPLLGAFHMLLNQRRLVALGSGRRLGDLLRASREYQSTVSNSLREQILDALTDLLRGFQQADSIAGGSILHEYRRDGGLQEVYRGLVTVLMRMVFILFAEERGLLPMESDLYASGYSLSRLHAQLAEDRNEHGDDIENRYGAWGRLITLFRLLHDGVRAADGLFIPARRGSFFDPDAFPFLEMRPRWSRRQVGETLDLPRVSDGTVFRALDRLLMLNGERLQYKGIDVEQVGEVYEVLMGFEVQEAAGDSLCLMPDHVVVDLEALARLSAADRLKELKAKAGLNLKDKAAGEIKEATSVEALSLALARRVSARNPGVIARGTLYLQPENERRRTGALSTPRSLVQPIVRTTLRPLLEQFGSNATPEQILGLKVCDPAMGSGAFLVEACRQLADELVNAWHRTGAMPELPSDEDPLIHARRRVARRCIYGVDKNPLAVDLARLSLWLMTAAREHSFTFVDHSLRHGDSLVGLPAKQLYNLSFDSAKGNKLVELSHGTLMRPVVLAEDLRRQILASDAPMSNEISHLWHSADDALATVRLAGDAMVASYFLRNSDKARKDLLNSLAPKIPTMVATGAHAGELRELASTLRDGASSTPKQPVVPFHWEIEFPEVFSNEPGRWGGFDAVVGNPPFAGRSSVAAANGEVYVEWLVHAFAGAHASSDVAAYFFRRAFDLLREGGSFGLMGTTAIAQGGTRATGLGWICANGGHLFEAHRHVSWPGSVVVVSVIHGTRGCPVKPCRLDGREVPGVTSFLLPGGGNDEPSRLVTNEGVAFPGSVIQGTGFIFDDESPGATPIPEMERLFTKDVKNRERVFPYQGGEELNANPAPLARRYVINFADMTEEEAWRWPDLMAIVEAKVRPERERHGGARRKKIPWWAWGQYSQPLIEATRGLKTVMVRARVSPYHAIEIVPSTWVMADSVVVFALESYAEFSVLQATVHETWARFAGSLLNGDVRYTPSDCFDTFPFPYAIASGASLFNSSALGVTGRDYYEARAELMSKNDEGLSKTYNRYHHPDERSPGIVGLRELHAAMDRAVLDAYGWSDINPVYCFRHQADGSVRYTWSVETEDEVLARLLGLNHVAASRDVGALSTAPGKHPVGMPQAPRADKIKRLTLRSFGAFEDVDISFVGGVNVFIGANGTGKTHAMKALYAALKPLEHAEGQVPLEVTLLGKFGKVFKPDEGQVGHLVRRPGSGEARVMLEGAAGKIDLTLHAAGERLLRLVNGAWPNAPSVVYLPARDVLAMYEGFIAAYEARDLSFDETFYDICVALGAGSLRGVRAEQAATLRAPLEQALGGTVVLRGNRFYLKTGDDLLEAHLLAEGLRKCATLAQLISNGSLAVDGVFFWDEPETNLNPRLIRLAADLLLDLASLGVQVFVTTHDYLLSHRLSLVAEYKRRPDVPLRFFAFHREGGQGPVRVDSGAILAELPDNPIVDEFMRHYDFERDLFDATGVAT